MPANTASIFAVLQLPLALMDKEETCTVTGSFGTVLFGGLLCPFCIPATMTLLSAMGLGVFSPHNVFWVVFLLLGTIFMLGLIWSYRVHRNVFPLAIGIVGVTAIPVGRYVLFFLPLTYAGVGAVVAAGIWNLLLKKQVSRACNCTQKK